MSDQYFVLRSSEDGTSVDGPLTREKLLERITPDENGETYYGRTGFHTEVPDSDKGCWEEVEGEEKLLVIKGTIVVPQPKQTVTEYDV